MGILKPIEKKINGVIFNLIIVGVLLLFLSALVVWTDFMIRLVMGVIILMIAYIFFYIAYRLWALKRDLGKYLKF